MPSGLESLKEKKINKRGIEYLRDSYTCGKVAFEQDIQSLRFVLSCLMPKDLGNA